MRIQKDRIETQKFITFSLYIIPLSIILGLFIVKYRDQTTKNTVFPDRTEIQVIAHRAGAALAPENTLAALECAIQIGADIAEVDVQMTKDGVVVAMHDDSLERTTDLCCCVWEANWATVRQADAGSWYSVNYAGEKIPTLEELLLAAKGRIQLMIEIKCTGHEQGVVEKVVPMIQSAGMEQECTIGCADISLLRLSKTLAPELETVHIGAVADLDLYALDYVDRYSLPIKTLTNESVARAKSEGKKIYTWTIDTEEEIRTALNCGVDGFVTDNPPLAMELLQ